MANLLDFIAHTVTGRALPTVNADAGNPSVRGGRYGEASVLSVIPTKHLLADEGSYFTVNGAQTGLATAAAPVAFSATNPFLLIYNSSTTNRIYLDAATLVATAAGTAGVNVQFAVTLDNGNRYTSGGTNLTASIVNANMDDTAHKSAALVYAGNLTATAATGAVRTVVGNRYAKGAIPVIGDTYTIRFGSADMPDQIGASTIVFSTNNVPAVVIGPGQSALIHLWLLTQSAASSYAPELSWWER